MRKQEQQEEPRDQFSLQVITWIQDSLRGTKVTNDRARQEKEFNELLNTPLEAFEN